MQESNRYLHSLTPSRYFLAVCVNGMPMHKMMALSSISVNVWKFVFYHSSEFIRFFVPSTHSFTHNDSRQAVLVYLLFHISLAKPKIRSMKKAHRTQKILSSLARFLSIFIQKSDANSVRKRDSERERASERPIYLFVKCLSIQKTQLSNFSWQTQTICVNSRALHSLALGCVQSHFIFNSFVWVFSSFFWFLFLFISTICFQLIHLPKWFSCALFWLLVSTHLIRTLQFWFDRVIRRTRWKKTNKC